MKKKIIFFISLFIILGSVANASDSVYLPCKKLKATQDKMKVESVKYDSTTGYDFTGNGKPRYYDSMYYNYYLEDPKYNMFYNYPAFYLPAARPKGR